MFMDEKINIMFLYWISLSRNEKYVEELGHRFFVLQHNTATVLWSTEKGKVGYSSLLTFNFKYQVYIVYSSY